MTGQMNGLRDLIRNPGAFWQFLQSKWERWLVPPADSNVQDFAGGNISFENSQLRVWMDNLFFEGILKPLETIPANLPHPWCVVGVVSKDENAVGAELAAMRRRLTDALGVESSNCVSDPAENHVIWWNFAGRFLNEAFASMLETSAGIEARFDDFSLKFPSETDTSRVTVAIRSLLADPDALRQLPISKQWLDGLKFSDCLPERFAAAAARGRIRVRQDALGTIRI